MSKIISINRKKIINETLYNLAIEKDESYIANGIIVHNCRSIMVPIMIDDVENPNSYYYDYKNRSKEFPIWGTNIPKGATQPAKGFGGIE